MMKVSILFSVDPRVKEFQKEQVYRFNNNKTCDDPPKSLSPAEIQTTLKFLDIHPCEIARQLTLLGQSCWLKLNCREFSELLQSNCNIKSYRHPWIDKMYKRREEIGRWLVSEIVLSTNTHQRVEIMKRFIEIAEYCLKYQNWADSESIIGGLKLQAVARLKITRKGIGKKYKKKLEALQKALQPDVLRETMRNANAPMIPVFEVYLRDFEMISELGDTLPDNIKMINVHKMRSIARLFEELERCKDGLLYPFRNIPQYQDYICFGRTLLNDEDAIRYSKTCEPERESLLA